jgi:HAD superfamily hydrolase (TIGR01509 family)
MMVNFAVILDMDGLMVDSEPLSRRAWDQVLERYGQTLDDKAYRRIIGHRTDESAAILIAAYNLPVGVNDLVQEKTIALARIRARGVPVMPGLSALHNRIVAHDLPWAVATSSPRAHAQEILKQLGLDHSCRSIAGGDEVVHGKPAPDIYLLAAERLGVHPRKCLAFEDSAPGCHSAAAAGMMVVAIPNNDTEADDFSMADYLYPSLQEAAQKFEFLLAELAKRQPA